MQWLQDWGTLLVRSFSSHTLTCSFPWQPLLHPCKSFSNRAEMTVPVVHHLREEGTSPPPFFFFCIPSLEICTEFSTKHLCTFTDPHSLDQPFWWTPGFLVLPVKESVCIAEMSWFNHQILMAKTAGETYPLLVLRMDVWSVWQDHLTLKYLQCKRKALLAMLWWENWMLTHYFI